MKFHKIIGKMIACSNQSCCFVEDTGFIQLMRIEEPRYKVPSRNYLKQTEMPNMYETCKKNFRLY